MCTVTFIPSSQGIYLTSNRDENTLRRPALPPEQYQRNGYELIYPQDQQAAGSWIALKDNGDCAVLLNGAFRQHQRRLPYEKSRGIIFLDIVEDASPHQQFISICLKNIEPFTLLIFSGAQLHECRWDGMNKHTFRLDASKPYIWSSATLYDDIAADKRKRWFLEWFSSTTPINMAKVTGFHQFGGKDDHQNGLIINRNNKIRTTSITSIFISRDRSQMNYRDLQTGMDSCRTFDQTNTPATENRFQKAQGWFRRAKIRLTNWEYWPMHLLYGPLYLYWLWLSFKARSFFFFSAANPGIQYSGFVQEKKSDIYQLIPEQYYPRTICCPAGTPANQLLDELGKNNLDFPIIAKPDMGEKGIQVKLLRSRHELKAYCSRSKVDFLLQEFIRYEQEIGIFYYRIPGEEKGHVSGIVGKEFLSVTGDGRSTIESLLKQKDRSLLQLPALRYSYGNLLHTVLAEAVQYILVPYGNHSRGTRFINMSHKITGELRDMVDKLCKQIPGFYYGRLDIKFNSWKELSEGTHFSIIELNGAGSEPTHIYDPANSLLYAWREITRHWKLLYRISQLNAQRKSLALMSTRDGIKLIRDHFRHLRRMTQV